MCLGVEISSNNDSVSRQAANAYQTADKTRSLLPNRRAPVQSLLSSLQHSWYLHIVYSNKCTSSNINHSTMLGVGVTQAKVITNTLFHLYLLVMCNFIDSVLHENIIISIKMIINSPLVRTCGNNRFVHSTSHVCDIECSRWDTVKMPTTL